MQAARLQKTLPPSAGHPSPGPLPPPADASHPPLPPRWAGARSGRSPGSGCRWPHCRRDAGIKGAAGTAVAGRGAAAGMYATGAVDVSTTGAAVAPGRGRRRAGCWACSRRVGQLRRQVVDVDGGHVRQEVVACLPDSEREAHSGRGGHAQSGAGGASVYGRAGRKVEQGVDARVTVHRQVSQSVSPPANSPSRLPPKPQPGSWPGFPWLPFRSSPRPSPVRVLLPRQWHRQPAAAPQACSRAAGARPKSRRPLRAHAVASRCAASPQPRPVRR